MYGFQPMSQAAQCLVMGTVDTGFLSVEPAEPGTVGDYRGVVFVPVFISVTF